ncbi:hypothetical protein, partial [Pedobacter borealis]|uniref:hypothetical protein n=1 Tax=Pedobacter borealis TaxID=475254 RepID=UPI000561A7E9
TGEETFSRDAKCLSQNSAAVVVLHFRMQKGPNVRMAKETGSLWQSVYSGTTLENCLYEGRTASESKI